MPQAIDMLTQTTFAVVPMHVIKKFGKDWTKPSNFVGNGPFILQDWQPKSRITVTRNKTYWDVANVRLDRITFLPFDDQRQSYDKFNAGEIDWLAERDLSRIDEIKLRKDYQHSGGSTNYYYLFNLTKVPFSDVRVRKALSMAIDRQAMCEKLLGTGEMPTGGFVPSMGTFTTARGTTFNPEEARKLLAEAGYPGGKGFPKIKVVHNTYARHKKIAEWVKEQWKSILGIEIKLDDIEWNRFLKVRSSHAFDVARAGWQGDFADPVNYLDLFKSNSRDNDGEYSDKGFDALLEKASGLPQGEARDKVLMQTEDLLVTQDQAVMPFFFYVNQNLIDLDRWGGWYDNTMNVHPWKAIYRK
jgi:oligopeptide transport system substrate-binding protein